MRKPLRYLLAITLWPPVYLHDRLTGVDPPASFRRGLDWARGVHEPTISTSSTPAVVRAPECQGADFSKVAAALAEGVEEHIRRDNLIPIKAALFRARGGHAPGDVCPSDPNPEPPHGQSCELLYDGDECTCGAWRRQATRTTSPEPPGPIS